jgi:DNA-binding transcriptional LysR family regulator
MRRCSSCYKKAEMERNVADSTTIPGDLADLRAFITVADLGSITQAAKTLQETKGSVSRRVSRLERALGVSLVRRSPRLVSVTEDGAAFRARVGRALELLEDATHELQAARSTPRGLLRITMPTDMGAMFAPLITGFMDAYPDVKVEAILTQAPLDFDAHQLDIAIRATAALRDSSLVAHKLLDLEMGFYAAPSYLAKKKAPRKPEDLAEHRIVAMRFRGGDIAFEVQTGDDTSQREKVSLKGVLMANDNDFVREACLAGAGIAPLPTVFAVRDVADGALVRVLEKYRILFAGALYLMHSSSPFMPPKVRAFREYMTTAMKKQCDEAGKRRRG